MKWFGRVEIPLLAALVAAPFLTLPLSLVVFLAAGLAWLATRPLAGGVRERWYFGPLLLAAALCLAAGPWLDPPGGLPIGASPAGAAVYGEPLEAGLQESYRRLWDDLDDRAQRVARPQGGGDLTTPGRVLSEDVVDRRDQPDRAPWMTRFERVLDGGPERLTLLLVDPDGEAWVWAGEGLLHELEPWEIPRGGRSHKASFGAVTLLSVLPLTEAPRPWRVVAARSLVTDRLPFLDEDTAPGRRWSLTDEPRRAIPGALRLTAPRAPTLVVAPRLDGPVTAASARIHKTDPAPPPSRRWSWGLLALGLLGLTVLRLSGPGPGREPDEDAAPPAWPLFLLGTGAASLAAALSWGVLGLLTASAGVAYLGIARHDRFAAATGGFGAAAADAAEAAGSDAEDGAGGPIFSDEELPPPRLDPRDGLGAAAVAGLGLVTWGWQQSAGPVDLAASLGMSPGVAALRLAVFLLAVGLLLAASRPRHRSGATDEAEPPDANAWLAVGALLLAGALQDLFWLAAPFLLAGGVLASRWLRHPQALRSAARVAVVALLAALTAAGVWETTHRQSLRRQIEHSVLPAMSPPRAEEVAAWRQEVERHFADLDLAYLAPRPPDGLERRDLAFQLWRDSPLARANTLSALLVIPETGPRSQFSFGLRLDGEGEPTQVPPAAAGELPLVWETARSGQVTELRYRGRTWARVAWWLAPRPGFRFRRERPQEETGAALLAGGPRSEAEVEELLPTTSYALYGVGGRPLLAPWSEDAAPVAPEVAAAAARGIGGTPGSVRAAGPTGDSWAFAAAQADGIGVVYLPVLTAAPALERLGTHAVSVLLVVGLLALAALLLALPRPAFRRRLQDAFRSYSQRLIIVYTLLLLLPLLLVNVLLVAGAEDRMEREQRANGLDTLDSVQTIVSDYMLNLSPGFDLKTQLDDDYLTWLARVVHHDVNLYWENDVWASSKAELFTAGLLPKRIPGEVHDRLRRGHQYASRTNRVGSTSYLELYTPARIPGEPEARVPLALSLPMLAQQAEVARDLAALRRQVFLVTAALFALLVAVGLRLARSFTEPIEELVAGTRRIAGGAPSLGLEPRELELAALARAIDDMAGRIDLGRKRLLREKEVVERMVDNITSGVVSLDREHRVVLRNRVAADLLGVEVGQRLVPGKTDLPEPVAEFLDEGDASARRKTVRLARREGGEGATGDGDAGEREWNLVWVPVPGGGEPAALLVVEDATEVLQAQRLEAWAEMARIIAHEIKNPLTPIRLNAEHARLVHQGNPEHFERIFETLIGNILAQVDELQQIASEFSTYSSLLTLERKPDDLVDAMEELVGPYRAAPPPGVEVHFESDRDALPARFDRRLLSRAVRNLLENALRASAATASSAATSALGAAGGNGPGAAGELGRVTVAVTAANGTGRISVTDTGPGVPPDHLGRIFDPYFSTHDTGTGLGLPIARRVVEEHGGGIVAENRPDGGLTVSVTLPV